MREILFRGKRVDNGEWVQGYLFQHWGKSYILWGTLNGSPIAIEVIPETVGQYTGMKDKNGNKIFEGDTLKCTDELDEVNELNSDTGIGNVEWLDKYGFWNISGIENSLGDIIIFGYVEIIGNIHESED